MGSAENSGTMTHDPQRPPPPPPDLQFDRVQPLPPTAQAAEPAPPATPGVTACAACAEPITDVYFEANGKIVCPACRDAVATSMSRGPGIVGVIKAIILGIVAGAIGAAVWWGVRKIAKNSEWGIIAIGVGLLVGGAVRYGSGGRGGRGYQVLAVILTYLAVSANYLPDLYTKLQQMHGPIPAPVALVMAAFVAVQVPFLGGIGNIIGMIIIAFALWEAWQINRPTRLTFNGPYRLAPAAA